MLTRIVMHQTDQDIQAYTSSQVSPLTPVILLQILTTEQPRVSLLGFLS